MSMLATVDSASRQVKRPRSANDFYVEEPWMVRGLFDVQRFEGPVWDPACGTGTIVKAARSIGLDAIGSDIVHRGWPEHEDDLTKTDFLTGGRTLWMTNAENVICNPPFNLAAEFVRRALHLVPGKVAMLLRLAFIESVGRSDLFTGGHFMALHPFARRGHMPPGGSNLPRKGGAVAFAWFVWSRRHNGDAIVKRIERGPNG